jgi:hypothetical protein
MGEGFAQLLMEVSQIELPNASHIPLALILKIDGQILRPLKVFFPLLPKQRLVSEE